MADPNLPPGFGDPESVLRVGGAAQQTASELDRLTATVNRDVANTVPDMFGGESASWFQRQWHSMSRVLNGMGSPMEAYQQGMDLAAQTMRQARDQLQDAQDYIARERLYITPDMRVLPLDPTRPDAQAVTTVAQGKLDAARALAERSQQQIRYANRMLERMGQAAQRELMEIAGAGFGRGRRPRPTQRNSATPGRQPGWDQHDREIEQSRRRLNQQYTLDYERGVKFRQELGQTYPMPNDGRNYVAHHNFPVKHSADFQRVGIDTTNPAWGSWVERGAHERFSAEHTRLWDDFFRNNPQPTRNQVLDFGRQLGVRFNHETGF